jgi:hypothetical protein
MAAILKAVQPVLGARDVAATVQWYVERLGFTCRFDDGGAPIRYAGISRDGVELHLQWQDDRYFPPPDMTLPAIAFSSTIPTHCMQNAPADGDPA